MSLLLKKIRPNWLNFNQLGFALIGGVLMGLTVAPTEAWFLAWIALIPLWILINESPDKGVKSKIIYALAWGFGYHGLAIFWITGIHPMTWMGVPWLASLAIALFCWLSISFWGAALVAFWAIGMSVLNLSFKGHFTKSLIRVLIGAALWCGLEGLWSLGAIWGASLSYTQSPHNLAILHLGQLSGPTTITAAIVAVNGLIAESFLSKKIQKKYSKTLLLSASIFLIIVHLIGFNLYNRPLNDSAKNALKVGIIQGNIPNDIKLYIDGKQRALENYTAGYESLANRGVEAILTPEVALPYFLDQLRQTNFYSAILDKKVVAWVGAYGEQGRSYTNSLFTITGTGEVYSQYNKFKLVPLGEYIPFESVLGKVIDRLSPLNAHLAAGKPNQVFDTPFGRAMVGICYESAFSEHFRRQAALGGEFILTSSNNAHYSVSMPAQHHAQDVMRAIESDRWAVRATNTGYSGIVDPHGRTIWISGIKTYETHADTVYRRQTQTLYVRWGDWLMRVLLGLGAIAYFFNIFYNSPQLR